MPNCLYIYTRCDSRTVFSIVKESYHALWKWNTCSEMQTESQYRSCSAPHVLGNALGHLSCSYHLCQSLSSCMVSPIIFTFYCPEPMGTSILATSRPRDQHQNQSNQPAHHRNPRFNLCFCVHEIPRRKGRCEPEQRRDSALAPVNLTLSTPRSSHTPQSEL
jgi:hypothetical protein